MILKPYSERDREEDIGLGFYDGQEVDCKEIVEEHLMLSIPYKVCCSELETCTNGSKDQMRVRLRQWTTLSQGHYTPKAEMPK